MSHQVPPSSDSVILEALLLQARSCESLGSPMYSRLLHGIAADFDGRGVIHALLHRRPERPVHDALPLRLLGAVHRIALAGRAPAVAARFPSCGGDGEDLEIVDFLDVVRDNRVDIEKSLGQQVQTNEVGRSVVPLVITQWLGNRGIDEIDHLEIGASAGLNLNFDSFAVHTRHGRLGADLPVIEFSDDWMAEPPPVDRAPARVMDRSGCDPHPIDVSDDEAARRLLSFVWPDQLDRIARLRQAIEFARRRPVAVERASAEDFLQRRLASPLRRPTVVFHSIVWQYLAPATRERVREVLAETGRRATSEHPLIWARMEPAGDVADVRVDVMSGRTREEHRLAEVGYHGQGLRWI